MRQMQRFLQIGTNAANAENAENAENEEIPSNWDKCGKCRDSFKLGQMRQRFGILCTCNAWRFWGFWCRVSSAESFKIFRQLGIVFLVGSRTRTWLFTSCVYHRVGSTIARHGQCVYSKVASEHLFGFSEICSGSTFDWNYTAQWAIRSKSTESRRKLKP